MDLETVIQNRDTIKGWEPEKANNFLSMAFTHFVQPKLKGLSDKDAGVARDKWIGAFLGKPSPLPEGFGAEKPQTGILTDVGRAGALALGGAGTGVANMAGFLKPSGVDSPLQNYFKKEGEFFSGLGDPLKEKHPWVSWLAETSGEFAPGGELAKAIGPLGVNAGRMQKALHYLMKGGAAASSMSKTPEELAKNAALFAGLDAVGGKLLEKLLGKFGKGAEKATTEATQATTEAPMPTTAPLPSAAPKTVTDIEKNAFLDNVKAPPGDLKARESWLYDSGSPAPAKDILEYDKLRTAGRMSEAKATMPRSVQFAPKEVKEAVLGLDRDEQKRVAAEARKLVKIRIKAGEVKATLTPEEIAQIKTGKTAEQVFNPASKPEVVAEQPQVKPFVETPKVEEPEIKAPTATKITQPKEVKIPDLGDKLLAGRYKVAVMKAGKSPEEVAAMVDEDAQTLAKKIMDSGDSEAVKLGKLQHIHEQQRFLKGKALAEEFGKTSGLAKTAKQAAKRPETYGESTVRGLKEKERIAASGSTRSRADAFVAKYGRSPEPDEMFFLESGQDIEQSVNRETQEDFLAKKRMSKDADTDFDKAKSLLPYVALGATGYGAAKMSKSSDQRYQEAGVGLGALLAFAVSKGKVGEPEVEKLALRSAAEMLNTIPSELTSDITKSFGMHVADFDSIYAKYNATLNKAMGDIPILQSLKKGIELIHNEMSFVNDASRALITGKNIERYSSTPVQIRAIQAVIDSIKESIPENVRLYRGEFYGNVSPADVERIKFLDALKSGDVYTIDKLSPFSKSKKTSEVYGSEMGPPDPNIRRYVFETVGPIKRLNVAIRSAYPEKESISFGSFKVIKTEDSRFIHKLGPYKLEKPIRRIILQQRGF